MKPGSVCRPHCGFSSVSPSIPGHLVKGRFCLSSSWVGLETAFPASFQQKLTLLEEDHKDGERWKAGGATERSI